MCPFDGEYTVIPELTQGALTRYVENRIATGGFLAKVLANDLFGAVGHADENNLRALPAIVRYVYNCMPSECWGDADKVKAWLVKQ